METVGGRSGPRRGRSDAGVGRREGLENTRGSVPGFLIRGRGLLAQEQDCSGSGSGVDSVPACKEGESGNIALRH